MAQYARFSKRNPQWENFINSQPKLAQLRSQGQGNDPASRRAVFQSLAAEGPRYRKIPDDNEVETHDFTIPARDGYQIPVRSYFPRKIGLAQDPALFVYYHGGGWAFGDLETGDDNCRLLCARNNLTVLNVDYRLAPTHPFPTGINDAYDAFVWAAQNTTANTDIGTRTHGTSNGTSNGTHNAPLHSFSLRADLTKAFIVGGVSAGANMAGVIAYLARDENIHPPITGLLLSVPCCVHPDALDLLPSSWRDEIRSLDQNKDADLLDVDTYVQLVRHILQAAPEDPNISFLLNKDHTKLPQRAYFQIAGLDPIRDEAMLFDRLLREQSGAETLVHMYDGLPHGFWRFQGLPASQRWADDLFDGVEFLLGGGKSRLEVKGHEAAPKVVVNEHQDDSEAVAVGLKDEWRVEVNGLHEYISGISAC